MPRILEGRINQTFRSLTAVLVVTDASDFKSFRTVLCLSRYRAIKIKKKKIKSENSWSCNGMSQEISGRRGFSVPRKRVKHFEVFRLKTAVETVPKPEWSP